MVEWIMPQITQASYRTGLRLLNSFTQKKEEFIPITAKKVYWYMCGPTVYSNSHMGHARCYVTADSIRKLLVNYFNYDVTLCMNITDIDDKIILKSREQKIPFHEVARYWEKDFFEDMKKLNVELPNMVTRVSEFIPEILEFIQGIMCKGFAYEANGSVYFDTAAFKQAGHMYGKLEPWNVDNSELAAEGEGALTTFEASEKKLKSDFALWKKSKEDEPQWESPWGLGRPGWHIECSAMACSMLPNPLDIHSGGIDLRFPHHDNEIAQTEGYSGQKQWVNYFLHGGHLNIKERKMSKSLKNFITIKEMLEQYNSNQIRMIFLKHRWDTVMNVSETSWEESMQLEKQWRNFLLGLDAIIRQNPIEKPQKWGNIEKQLWQEFQVSKENVHQFLLDNLDTPGVIQELGEFQTKVNKYIAENDPKITIIEAIKSYYVYISRCLGFQWIEQSQEELTPKILDILMELRNTARISASLKEILAKTDEVRDVLLPNIGIQLEDQGQKSVWKIVGKEILAQQMQEEQKKANELQEQKEKALKEKQEKELKNKEKASIKPQDLFRNEKYSQWDEEGVPTHDAQGVELSKNQKKTLKKQIDQQKKLYAKYNP